MITNKKKIINLIRIFPLVSVISVAIILILVSIFSIKNYFRGEAKKVVETTKYESVYDAKKIVRTFTALTSSINHSLVALLKDELKVGVNVEHRYVKDIYLNHTNLSKLEVVNLIKKKIADLKCSKLVYVIKQGRIKGFHREDNKLYYFKYCKYIDYSIGAYISLDKLKYISLRKYIQIVSRINNIKKDNLIILNKDYKVLYAQNHKLMNEKLDFLSDYLVSKSIETFEYNNRVFISKYYKPLNIYIITEVDLKTVSDIIKNKQAEIDGVLKNVIKQFLTVSVIFIVLIIILTFYFARMIEKIFDKYDESINEAKENAEKAAKVKSEFLANMSHEIRTPLNAMFGFIRILQELENDQDKRKYLNIIEKSGENLLTIINDILDFSKIESGKFNIEKIEFNPKEEILILKELFASKASEKNILLTIKKESLKYNIISDPTRIKQVIANLLSNAIKFTPENKKIELCIKYDDNKEELYIEVKDEGIGIPKDKLKHIFEEFSQADSSTTRKYGGTGLGLTISYKLVQLLGGELKVESEVNKGSKFYFSIPAKKAGLAKEIDVTPKKMLQDKFDLHLLLVEDNKANQMFMKVILKKLGISFDIANDGIEAIEMYKNNKYNLILMDENMPRMNGIEATKNIRKIEREKNKDPIIIIALTANALEGDRERFILSGMNYYLSKPLDIEKLKDILRKL